MVTVLTLQESISPPVADDIPQKDYGVLLEFTFFSIYDEVVLEQTIQYQVDMFNVGVVARVY